MILTIQSFVLSLIILAAPLNQNSGVSLSDVQQKYDSIENFTANFRQVTGDGHVATGLFYYESKDKFRIELDNRLILSNGEIIWNYSPNIDKVIISPVEDNGTSFSLNDYVYKYPEKCTVSYEEEDGKNVIILKPKNTELDFKEVKIWPDDNAILKQIQLIDLMGNKFTVELRNIKLNQNLADDLFTFTPTEGTKVIDLR